MPSLLYCLQRTGGVNAWEAECFQLAACRLKCSHEVFAEQIRAQGCYEADTLQFMDKILQNSGVGEEAYMPPGKHNVCTGFCYLPIYEHAMFHILINSECQMPVAHASGVVPCLTVSLDKLNGSPLFGHGRHLQAIGGIQSCKILTKS